MSEDKLLSISEAAGLLGVNPATLRRWTVAGKVACHYTVGHQRKYLLSEVRAMQGKPTREDDCGAQNTAVYVRVSSGDQKRHGDLDRQKTRVMEYCVGRRYRITEIISDCASAMNYKRPGLEKLYALVCGGKINRVVVEHRDRLVRFGYDCIEEFFKSHGVAIECIEKELPKSFEAELVEDVVSLMTSFAAKLHSRRNRRHFKEA